MNNPEHVLLAGTSHFLSKINKSRKCNYEGSFNIGARLYACCNTSRSNMGRGGGTWGLLLLQ